MSSARCRPQERGEAVDLDREEAGLDSQEDDEGDVFPPSQSERMTEEQEEKIAALFEDHSAFYDIASSDYKNKDKKNALLREFGKSIGMDGEYFFIFSLRIVGYSCTCLCYCCMKTVCRCKCMLHFINTISF